MRYEIRNTIIGVHEMNTTEKGITVEYTLYRAVEIPGIKTHLMRYLH